jgi:hypothetical protein
MDNEAVYGSSLKDSGKSIVDNPVLPALRASWSLGVELALDLSFSGGGNVSPDSVLLGFEGGAMSPRISRASLPSFG